MTVIGSVSLHQHPAYTVGARTLQVQSVTPAADLIATIVFVDPDGGPLAAYEPGSHLVVVAGEYRNAYSLVGDGVNPKEYVISVLRRGAGGGSDFIHENFTVGTLVDIEGPRSMFAPQYDQKHALLVAGGIGITPVLSHARAARRWGLTADIVYAYRPDAGAHLPEIREVADGAGIRLFEAHDRTELITLLKERFADQRLGSHAYACGPIGMLDTYLELGHQAGWPDFRLHVERFEAPELDPGVDFEAVIASTGRQITVSSGVSLLEALGDAGVEVPSLCRQGVCGECRIPVRSGVIEHRDLVLSDDEKASGTTMLSCVSRGERIEVDL